MTDAERKLIEADLKFFEMCDEDGFARASPDDKQLRFLEIHDEWFEAVKAVHAERSR